MQLAKQLSFSRGNYLLLCVSHRLPNSICEKCSPADLLGKLACISILNLVASLFLRQNKLLGRRLFEFSTSGQNKGGVEQLKVLGTKIGISRGCKGTWVTNRPTALVIEQGKGEGKGKRSAAIATVQQGSQH